MSLDNTETPLLHRYWREIGGTLIEEFTAVRRGNDRQRRRIDGIIIPDGDHVIASQADVPIEGKDIIVVQVKSKTLGMNLLGQALFSKLLMEQFSPRSIESVALCTRDDAALRPLFERFDGCRVVVYDD